MPLGKKRSRSLCALRQPLEDPRIRHQQKQPLGVTDPSALTPSARPQEGDQIGWQQAGQWTRAVPIKPAQLGRTTKKKKKKKKKREKNKKKKKNRKKNKKKKKKRPLCLNFQSALADCPEPSLPIGSN